MFYTNNRIIFPHLHDRLSSPEVKVQLKAGNIYFGPNLEIFFVQIHLFQIHFNRHLHSSAFLGYKVRLTRCAFSSLSLPPAYLTNCSFFQPAIHSQNTFSASACLWKSSQIPESYSVKFSTPSLQFYILSFSVFHFIQSSKHLL